MAGFDSLPPESTPSLEDLLAEIRSAAHGQLQAASQLQIDRLREQIAGAWQDDLRRVMEERLADAALRIESWHRREAAGHARRSARRDLSEQLNRAVRRLRDFETEEQWSQVLVDGTQGFCERAAVFSVNGPSLEFKAARGMAQTNLQAVPLSSAPAFASAVETRDTVVAMRTRGELSVPVALFVGESPGHRSTLFPLTARDRVAAILYADSTGQEMDPAALEMLCSVASLVLEGLASSRAPQSGELVNIAASGSSKRESSRAAGWSALNRAEQSLHLRAQHFARVTVAEMLLYKAQAVQTGRAGRNLYEHLKSEIDTGRETFRSGFLSESDSMVDYLHLELLRTLAHEDAALLGPEYPGSMV